MRYFTNSEVVDYLTCRRSWAIKHVYKMGRQAEHISENRETGNYVHAVLENQYVTDWQDDPYAVLELEYSKSLDRAVNPDTGLLLDEDKKAADSAREYARVIIEGYVEWLAEEGADSDLTFEAAEQVVQFPIYSNAILLGKLDATFRRERDGARVVFDHKVVQTFSDMHKTAHLNPQFKTYLALDRAVREEGEWTDGLVVNMLRRTKRTGRATPPFYERLEVRHNETVLRNHWTQLMATINDMLVDEEVLLSEFGESVLEAQIQPNPTRDCSWRCSFYEGCSLVDDGSDWQGYLSMAMVPINPISRYEEELNAS